MRGDNFSASCGSQQAQPSHERFLRDKVIKTARQHGSAAQRGLLALKAHTQCEMLSHAVYLLLTSAWMHEHIQRTDYGKSAKGIFEVLSRAPFKAGRSRRRDACMQRATTSKRACLIGASCTHAVGCCGLARGCVPGGCGSGERARDARGPCGVATGYRQKKKYRQTHR